MRPEERDFKKAFYQAVADRALESGHPFYVPIYERAGAAEDPIALLQDQIELTAGETSAHLVSGYRGSGKSTELRRLQALLEARGYAVVLIDIERYVNTAVPTDISDLLYVLAGALSDGLQERFGVGAVADTYWGRFVKFLGRIRFNVDEVSAGFSADKAGASLAIRASIKADPSFQRRLQQHLADHLGALVVDVGEYVEELIGRVRRDRGDLAGVVLIVDSIEHFHDAVVTDRSVQDSIQVVFAEHADRLRFPGVHAIYTIPPFVRVRAKASLTARYDGEAIMLRAVRLEERIDGVPFQPGLETLVAVVERRGDWQRVFGSREQLDTVLRSSGGHLRDLLRIVQAVITRATSFPVDDLMIDLALRQIRGELLPIAVADAVWLDEVARTGDASLQTMDELNRLAQFLDTHLLLAYQDRNQEWYDVHPLVREHVRDMSDEKNANQR